MNVKLTEFSRQDWLAFAGCEKFKLIAPEVELTICGNSIDIPRGFAGNADPLIGELEDDITASISLSPMANASRYTPP